MNSGVGRAKPEGTASGIGRVAKLVAWLLVAMMPVCAMGQGRVEGVVLDSATAEPVPYAVVVWHTAQRSADLGTTADEKGRFSLALPNTDTATLRVASMGYAQGTVFVGGLLKRTARVSISLRPVATNLDPITISQERDRQTTFTAINAERLSNAVGPSSGVESLIKTLPDVSSSNELSSQYSVRGGSFDENLVYINGVELFRPMLIRSGQQEGMSIINPDLVSYIRFSPGGFEAEYGDKLSSVLDITYGRPLNFEGKLSASLLGASASVRGSYKQRLSYAAGLRWHNNSYILGSLDTRGQYTTSYADLQMLLSYRASERTDVGAIVIATRNVYGLVPESRTTTFGGFLMPMAIDIYFDGQEQDRYLTGLGALTLDYRPSEAWRVRGVLSAQRIEEREHYDVQSQYWLYELGLGEQAGETARFDRGVGTFLEHARNRLYSQIYTASVSAKRDATVGEWLMGGKVQMEQVDDRLREWRWVDSAGYAMPTNGPSMGDTLMPVAPVLQDFYRSAQSVRTLRADAYVRRELNWVTAHNSHLRLSAGLRAAAYNSTVDNELHTMVSPRVSFAVKPRWQRDLLFKLSGGIYQQAPFYREYRRPNGSLCASVLPQRSYQVVATADWNLRIKEHPVKLTADLYAKYLDRLTPYTVDNLRLRYLPDASAVGYAVGMSLRVNGELVEGLESWASISLMQTQEDIEGDGLGWLSRPTDQRFSFKMFLQDNIPTVPWWKMSLSFIYGSRMPVSVPMMQRTADDFRMPAYFRVDLGNTVLLSRFERVAKLRMMRHVEDVQLSLEVFNLFNVRNVASYIWVSDFDNRYFPVPNYLTTRQLNLKITILF